ncbi:MAG: Rieske 2Fe-2S domain-containing protein [Pseudomonadota bacterium]
MSVKYIPVQWNQNKWVYDGILLAAVGAYLWIFVHMTPEALDHERPINGQIHNARAFGSCAFLMMTVILCIGPLARLDRRFLPLLYNRRHFGVLTVFVALSHFGFVFGWYYAFSPFDSHEAVLFSNTAYGQVLGFPFEALGVFALICLLILAATSHDFWMKFLTPRIWKSLHYLIYPAYVAVVAHAMLGAGQDLQNQSFVTVVGGSAALVVALHAAAAWHEWSRGDPQPRPGAWERICLLSEMREGFAKVAELSSGDRVAVFLHEGRLSAISNHCAHQNGPLGEGRIIDCLVTCPWHGFQYRVTDGRSPAPFTEKVPTYRVRLSGSVVEVDPKANPPGTYVEPLAVEAP